MYQATQYITSPGEISAGQLANFNHDFPQPAHWRLVAMLILTQCSVGLLISERLLDLGFTLTEEVPFWYPTQAIVAAVVFGLAVVGVGISSLGLGDPKQSIRTALEWRASWLIRENIALNFFVLAATANVAFSWSRSAWDSSRWGVALCGWLAAAVGIVATAISAMVYVSTQREVWSLRRVFQQFAGSILLIGLTSGLVTLNLARINTLELRYSPFASFVSCILLDAIAVLSSTRLFNSRKAMRRHSFLNQAGAERTLDARIVDLLAGPLSWHRKMRTGLGLLSGGVFLMMVASQATLTESYLSSFSMVLQTLLVASVVFTRLLSEVLERYLFFVTAVSARMPAGLR